MVNDLDQSESSSRVGEELHVELSSQGRRRPESKAILDKERLGSAIGSPVEEVRSLVSVEPRDIGGDASGGNTFTWCRNWSNNSLLRRLDRVLCNEALLEKMANCEVNIPSASISDQCPMDIIIHQDRLMEPKPFRFFEFWIKHESYDSIVKEAWEGVEEGNGLSVLQSKLKKMRALESKCSVLALAEKNFYRDKSRAIWLEEGDANTLYFHSKLKAVVSRNKIVTIKDADGKLLTDYEEVKEEAVIFYKKLFAAPEGDVVEAIKTFFATSCMSKSLNSTNVVLIPKTGNSQNCGDSADCFHPWQEDWRWYSFNAGAGLRLSPKVRNTREPMECDEEMQVAMSKEGSPLGAGCTSFA
ncbi:hypothetical protein LIER_22818 [Lithospermum erythrorhizon]|uniref:Uncharacterized protein n=1 Tax=Lithospermum erythrorhizon TaxID=34254 RepID=A0AAV3QVC5_LITER